jgi:hypothetical protein
MMAMEATARRPLLEPILAPLLRERRAAMLFSGMAVVQIVTTACGITLMQCPMLHWLGVPCPTCGLTRACVALLRGSNEWVRFHALAPIALITIALLSLAAILPATARTGLADRVETVERRTALPALALAAVLLYWIVRLIYAPAMSSVLLVHH